MLEWFIRLPDWIASAWIALGVFIATQIEPSSGVIAASGFGALAAITTGRDRTFTAAIVHAITCICVGVFASQIVAEFVQLKSPFARGAFAFFLALFAEKLIVGVGDGSMWKAILAWKGMKK